MTIEKAIKLLANATYSEEWQGNEDLQTAHNMAIEALKQETVSRESYEHEYFLRKEFERKIAKLEKTIEELEQEQHEDRVSRAEAMTEIQMNARRYTLAKEFGGMGQVEWSDYLISIKDALDILRKLPPITPAFNWIPVSERLPEQAGEYLVTYRPYHWGETFREHIRVGVDSFRGKTTWAKNKYQRVIAWLPLPKPYNAENEE